MTSIERTAYPQRFKRLITAHELHLLFSPTREEAWAAERMDSDEHQLAMLPALKSYQRMGRFPKPEAYPEAIKTAHADFAALQQRDLSPV
ncbi:hypothetical protein ACFY04_42945 [Streptomyces sp. NPDC001549]|uniref:hypothetical protein n=1 Tax=Streptomyces sp. NPDC001549 TaxID=3364586 RepID=UPI00367BDC1A